MNFPTTGPDELTIFITEEDFEKGIPTEAHACVIAQAIIRQAQSKVEVSVRSSNSISIGSDEYTGATPKDNRKIGAIIGAFDDEKHIKPNTIRLKRKTTW